MSILDKIKDRINSGTVAIEVKEWGETIYVTPLSCGDMGKLQKRHPNFLGNMTAEGMVDLIVLKAMDKEGEKVFTIEDKPILLRESLNVVASISAAIIGSQIEEDHEKN